ncbi:hypothetical protein GUITHDRAFT_120189 [Guillardia theta CCMP2712]|uniref:tRNA(Ile)-lysidine/2-thiocytidine synthase N-terminal domain-containing protein n=1 Tax=Guillardia theta (strain CCMP2712) TaxID=905079 RepID=L1IBI7_GUITC|nr:hypothetical protein GUITHDRAFT_120189 [Guillardia theta CCMP2712]EKX33598.1 hypothetical protein GUITHDRAFT_120189 [Guillardia theta CCMP2712]|eukprot:XP_005820578.1 hypothetical protein GUITHDRAFT_120189 [Guillardia theta CCMP2712]
MLGHHQGDVEENVISNVMKGSSVLNLAGMKEVQYMTQYRVELQRPLLSLHKHEIYNFSMTYGVPYFKDTTPSWSTRGKLRGVLIPVLKDIYGDGVMSRLSSIAKDAYELSCLVQSEIFETFWSSIEFRELGNSLKMRNGNRNKCNRCMD